MTLTDIATAWETRLGGLVLTTPKGSTSIDPIIGLPEPEYVKRDYPVINVELIDFRPAWDRHDLTTNSFGKNPTTSLMWVKSPYEPVDISYQVSIWSRFSEHCDSCLMHVQKKLGRFSYLEIDPVTVTGNVAVNDTVISVNDNSEYDFGDIFVVTRTGTPINYRQAFIVTGTMSNSGIVVDPAARIAFTAGAAVGYKARFEVFQISFNTETGQDAGRPYYRYTLTYDVRADLDFKQMAQEPYTKEIYVNGVPLTNIIQA